MEVDLGRQFCFPQEICSMARHGTLDHSQKDSIAGGAHSAVGGGFGCSPRKETGKICRPGCREWQGDFPVHCPATRRCSGQRGVNARWSPADDPAANKLGTGGDATELAGKKKNTYLY